MSVHLLLVFSHVIRLFTMSVCFRLVCCDLLVSGSQVAITFIILTLTPVPFSSKSDARTRTLGHPIAHVDSGITYLTFRAYNRSVMLCIRKNIALVIYFRLLNKNPSLKFLWRLARSIETEILMWRLKRLGRHCLWQSLRRG